MSQGIPSPPSRLKCEASITAGSSRVLPEAAEVPKRIVEAQEAGGKPRQFDWATILDRVHEILSTNTTPMTASAILRRFGKDGPDIAHFIK